MALQFDFTELLERPSFFPGVMQAKARTPEIEMDIEEKPDWKDYESKVQSYLNRKIFKDTPLSGKVFSEAAKKTYEKTGKFIPPEMMLSQAQFESFMGTKGRSPKENPFNVGEFDEGTKQTFKSTKEGVKGYYDLLSKDYLKDKTPEELLENFVNLRGDRYASDPNYEEKLKKQMNFIKGYWEKEEEPKTPGPQSKLSQFIMPSASAQDRGALEGFTGVPEQKKETPVLDTFANIAEKVMSLEEWEEFAEQEKSQALNFLKGIGEGLVAVGGTPGFMKPSGEGKPATPEDKKKLVDTLTYPLKQIGRIYEPIRAAIGAVIDKKDISTEVLRAFLKPETVASLTSRVPFQKAEQKGIMSLIPRATAEAIETLMIYSGLKMVKGIAKSKAFREAETKVGNLIQGIESKGVKLNFPEGATITDKAKILMQQAQSDPRAGNILKTALSTPAEVYAGVPARFAIGDIVKLGKESGKVLSMEGGKALLNIGGKEVSASFKDLKTEFKPSFISPPERLKAKGVEVVGRDAPISLTKDISIKDIHVAGEEPGKKAVVEPLVEEAKTVEEFVKAQDLQKAREEDVFTRPEFFDKGKSGLSGIEGFSEERPVLASMEDRKSIVFRDKNGIPQGVLSFDVTEKGELDIEGTSEIFVNTEFRRKGIATKLRQKSKELGFDISKIKDRAFTELGKKFEKSQLTDIWKKAREKPTIKPAKTIEGKPKLIAPIKKGKFLKGKTTQLPRGEGFTLEGLPQRTGLSPKKRLEEEALRYQEEKLGFTLKGKSKTIPYTPAEKMRQEGKIPVSPNQIKEAHMVARNKAFITPEGKTTPQYRKLATAITGKKSMKDMTKDEATQFIHALRKMSEPVRNKEGKLVPPSIPKGTKVTTKDFFKKKFREPGAGRYFTSQTYYSELLGVKPLVEPLERAKQEFDIQYRNLANQVENKGREIDKLAGTSLMEGAMAKLRNKPTPAIEKMANLLDTYEDAPPSLSEKEKEIFNWFRNITRTTWEAENGVRSKLGMEPIKYRRAYMRHTADGIAKEMLEGKYPFPEGLKYWAERVIGKRIHNPMAMQRQLADELMEWWSKDLIHVTKSMLWTGLKEVHLSEPLKFLNEQLGILSKDPKVYKGLTLEEKEIYDEVRAIPASTKKWLTDYVNQTIKGQQTNWDAEVNRLAGKGVKGIVDGILKPFGRTMGTKPITDLFQGLGRLTIHGVMGPIRPKQLIRNKFQTVQNLALYGVKSTLKGFLPATNQMKDLMSDSLFLKTYTGFEELPKGVLNTLEKLNLAAFQWSAVSNVKQAMKASYWDTMDLISNPKHKGLGWADSARTYKEPKEFLYPSEKAKVLKEMEFGAGVTQYHYIPMAMPEIFRHKTLIPFTRLQSWWMNHFFKFNREAASRMFAGETAYGAKLPWDRRVNYLKYLLLGGLILNTMDYGRSFLFGAAPTGLPPIGQLMLGLYNYTIADDKYKKEKAKKAIVNSMKLFIPGHLATKDALALWEGRKNLKQFLFYEKWQRRKTQSEGLDFEGLDFGDMDFGGIE